MNNIFSYAPKELTTDAFLAWLFTEFDENEELNLEAGAFFYRLGLCDSPAQKISQVIVSRQDKNVDLRITYHVDGDPKSALFENKTHTTFHSGQLERYKGEFSGVTYYKYLKLAYINSEERRAVISKGYAPIDVHTLHSALNELKYRHTLLDHYKAFLEKDYIELLTEIKQTLVQGNKYELFEYQQAQHFFLSKLYDELFDELDSSGHLELNTAMNRGGTSWSHICFSERKEAYGMAAEYIFWRIDRRSGHYYLRLNQYSKIDKEYAGKKKNNLKQLRELVTPLLESTRLTLAEVHNAGVNESEVVIMFFKDNNMTATLDHLADVTRQILQRINAIQEWD